MDKWCSWYSFCEIIIMSTFAMIWFDLAVTASHHVTRPTAHMLLFVARALPGYWVLLYRIVDIVSIRFRHLHLWHLCHLCHLRYANESSEVLHKLLWTEMAIRRCAKCTHNACKRNKWAQSIASENIMLWQSTFSFGHLVRLVFYTVCGFFFAIIWCNYSTNLV